MSFIRNSTSWIPSSATRIAEDDQNIEDLKARALHIKRKNPNGTVEDVCVFVDPKLGKYVDEQNRPITDPDELRQTKIAKERHDREYPGQRVSRYPDYEREKQYRAEDAALAAKSKQLKEDAQAQENAADGATVPGLRDKTLSQIDELKNAGSNRRSDLQKIAKTSIDPTLADKLNRQIDNVRAKILDVDKKHPVTPSSSVQLDAQLEKTIDEATDNKVPEINNDKLVSFRQGIVTSVHPEIDFKRSASNIDSRKEIKDVVQPQQTAAPAIEDTDTFDVDRTLSTAKVLPVKASVDFKTSATPSTPPISTPEVAPDESKVMQKPLSPFNNSLSR